MDSCINEEVPVPEGDEAKALHKKKLVMTKRIIFDSIKDHLIPKVSSLNTPKAIPRLMKSLREMITSELGSIRSPWSWKKMSWTPIAMTRF